MRATTFIAVFAIAILGAACARHARPGAPIDLNVITREQIAQNHFHNAYEAVAALRSNWLQVRGPDSFSTPSQILVYMGDTKLGGITELNTITAENVESMRHYDGNEATSRWGVGHSAGVIQIVPRKGP